MAISAFLAGVTGAVSWLAAAANAAAAAAQAAQAAQGAQGQAANRLGQVNNDAPKQGGLGFSYTSFFCRCIWFYYGLFIDLCIIYLFAGLHTFEIYIRV